MFVFFGSKQEVERVRGGRVVESDCPDCGASTDFYECRRVETVKAYGLLDLWDSEDTVFMCGNCRRVYQLAAGPDAGQPSSRASEAERTRQRQARKQADLLARKQRILAEKRAAEERRRTREREAAERAHSVEAELAALKRKLGRE